MRYAALLDAIRNIIQRIRNGRFWSSDGMRLADDFKSDAASIEEARVPLPVYSVLYLLLLLMAIAILWSVLGRVDRIVVAQGKIVTTAPLIVMQPFTTSKIQRIFVRPGDRVKKGQVLVAFDPGFARADQAALEQKVKSLEAEIARIEAELTGQPQFHVTVDAGPELQSQAALFAQRRAQYTAEVAVHDTRIGQIDGQISADQKASEVLRNQFEIATKVADVRQQLLAKQAGSILELMAAEKDKGDVDLRLKAMLADMEKLQQQRSQTVAERQSFISQWRSELNQKLVTDHQDQSQATQALEKAQKLAVFAELRSPVDAVVLELGDRSEGSVLREAETLVTLVPDDAQLNLEVNIPSRDVGFVSLGSPVRVKVEAYPFQQYGTLNGKLDVLSPDSVPLKEGDTTNVAFHAEIHLDQAAGNVAGSGIRLRPGLLATAEIKAGERSVASYILNPIIQTTDESMREP